MVNWILFQILLANQVISILFYFLESRLFLESINWALVQVNQSQGLFSLYLISMLLDTNGDSLTQLMKFILEFSNSVEVIPSKASRGSLEFRQLQVVKSRVCGVLFLKPLHFLCKPCVASMTLLDNRFGFSFRHCFDLSATDPNLVKLRNLCSFQMD